MLPESPGYTWVSAAVEALYKISSRSLEGYLVMQVHESGEGRSSTSVRVKHSRQASGNHVIRFCCGLWVYNCTGLPIALQQARPCPRNYRI